MTTGILFLWSCASKQDEIPAEIGHIVVIGVDGMSPDGIRKANTPMLDSMIQNGPLPCMHVPCCLQAQAPIGPA